MAEHTDPEDALTYEAPVPAPVEAPEPEEDEDETEDTTDEKKPAGRLVPKGGKKK